MIRSLAVLASLLLSAATVAAQDTAPAAQAPSAGSAQETGLPSIAEEAAESGATVGSDPGGLERATDSVIEGEDDDGCDPNQGDILCDDDFDE
ncbi:hypothetical protein [Amorphus sp. 3PC139-8]|uniref:hypothetical protein n=1 Tax=Amorphus sp. 3PC139-8 TaxID=2735676 RepID=UPI00345D2233